MLSVSRLQTETVNEEEQVKVPPNLAAAVSEQNSQLLKSLTLFETECTQITARLEELEVSFEGRQHQLSKSKPKKKNRRKANQIDKAFACPECMKAYGSEISLNLHVKLKHA